MTAKSFLLISLIFVLFSLDTQAQHRKLKKIQKYIDEATAENLSGIAIYIKSPKYGKWTGTSGFSDLENQIPLSKQDVFSMASIGKMYNAVAALKLAEEGRFQLDDKISLYLPKEIIENLPGADAVTIRHLLGQTSGFVNYNKDPELNRLYLSGQLKLDTLSHLEALSMTIYGKPLRNIPGTEYHYSSTNFMLMAMIMDKVVPEGHSEYLRKMVGRYPNTYYRQTPLSHFVNHYGDLNKDETLENLTKQTIETTNWYIGDDGVYAPIGEAARFLEDLMKGKILNEQSLKEMTTWDNEKSPDYGLGLMADKSFPYKFLMGHSGRGIGNTMDLYYFPKQDMSLAVFCNTGLRSAHPTFRNTYFKMRAKIVKKLFLF